MRPLEQIAFEAAVEGLRDAAGQEVETRRDKQARTLRVRLASLALDSAAVTEKARIREETRATKAAIDDDMKAGLGSVDHEVDKAKREARAATK